MKKIEILIVDDDHFNLLLCAASLRDYQTHRVNNGCDALENFLAIKPKVVILDYGMPNITGLEIAKQIRIIDDDCKIVIMSTFEHQDVEQGKHCDAFLMKPLSPKIIKSAVEKLLKKC